MHPSDLTVKYMPRNLDMVAGQRAAVEQLKSFTADPFEQAFIFHGPTGVGKTCTAKALAFELGCTVDFQDLGGISEIPSGEQDGEAVRRTLDSLRLRPMYGSGWKVVVANEADKMTAGAEAIWLDGLEHLPPKSVIVFTTNELRKLSKRLIGRCEVIEFDGSSDVVKEGMEDFIRMVWKNETGQDLKRVPANLGKYDKADRNYSIRLALK